MTSYHDPDDQADRLRDDIEDDAAGMGVGDEQRGRIVRRQGLIGAEPTRYRVVCADGSEHYGTTFDVPELSVFTPFADGQECGPHTIKPTTPDPLTAAEQEWVGSWRLRREQAIEGLLDQ